MTLLSKLPLVFAGVVIAACVREPNEIPPPEPACFETPACSEDADCEPRALARSQCVEGCCLATGHCLGDSDCVGDSYCDPRRGFCFPASTCEDTVTSRDCEAGSSCLFVVQSFGCAPVESLPAADNCEVRAVVGVHDDTIALEALALDSDGAPVAYGDVTWTSTVGDVNGFALVAACEEDVCDGTVSAVTIRGGAACEAPARIYAPLDVGASARVIVVDENNLPIEARVDALVDGALVSVDTTNASATFDGDVAFMTVFVDGRETNTYLAPAGDIIVVARPHDPTRATGVKGSVDFQEVNSQGDIRLALAGLTLPSLRDATREELLGFDVDVNVELEGMTDPGGEVVALPTNLTMLLGDNPIKGDYIALGTRTPAWVLGGKVPLAELGPALQGDLNFASLARAAMPFLARADHGFVASVPLLNSSRPSDASDFSAWDLSEHILTPEIAPLVNRELERDDVTHDLVTAALVHVPTRGHMVLGIGDASLTFAPAHQGLEGNDVLIAALDVDLDTLDDVRAVVAPLDSALPPFLPHLDSTFDGVTFTSANDVGASLYRVRFAGWNVWSTSPPSFDAAELGVSGTARAEAILEEEGTLAISSRTVD